MIKEVEKKNVELKIKNHFLLKRSHELGKLKIGCNFQHRTIRLCDSANFSDHIGYVDQVLLETEIKYMGDISSKIFSVSMMSTLSPTHYYFQACLDNGEYVQIKSYKKTISEEKALTLLGYEYKILSLVGAHSNIIEHIGLCYQNEIPGIVSHYVSDVNVKRYICRHKRLSHSFVRTFIYQLCHGLSYLHDKGILNNFITLDSIFLRCSSGYEVPVITDFRWACRENSAELLTIQQVTTFADFYHLPNRVRNGTLKPSRASDIYSYGSICMALSKHGDEYENIFKVKLAKIAEKCMLLKEFCNLFVLVDKYFED